MGLTKLRALAEVGVQYEWPEGCEYEVIEACSPASLLALLAELEAARAVVEAARSHASTSMCAAGRLLNALKAYDAAKAGEAVE